MFSKRDLININKNHMMHFLKQIVYLVPLYISPRQIHFTLLILTKRPLQFFSKHKIFEMEEKRSKSSFFCPFLSYHKSLFGTFDKILGPLKIWERQTLLLEQLHYLLNNLRINNLIKFLIIYI